jgi:predicted lipoprotein with Yx(FWY)xxD motif
MGANPAKALVLVAVAALAAGIAAGAPATGATDETQAASALKLRNTRYGRVLFDARDRVLYGFTRDRRGGRSTCYGACARAWPVYFSKGRIAAMRGVRRSLIGKVRRRDGRFQVTYNGWPLYFYAHEGPREVRCQGVDEFGGLWLVVRADGRLVR